MRQSHLMLSNAAIMWATRVLLLVPQVVLVPLLIKTIGDAGYGVYALVWALIVSLDQVVKALQSGVVKYSAASLARNRIDEVNRVVSTSSAYSLILAVLGCGLILTAAAFQDDASGVMTYSLAVAALTILLGMPLTPYTAVIQARQRYYVDALAETISKYVALLVLVLYFRMRGPSVLAPIVVMAGMLILSRLAQVPVAYRLIPGLRNHPKCFDWPTFRTVASFGGMVVLIGLCLMANSAGIRWLMQALASTSFVAHLAIIVMPTVLLSQVVLALTITVMPATSAYEATGNQKMLQELMCRGMRYSALIVLAALLGTIPLLEDLLALWVGPAYVFLAPYTLTLCVSAGFMLTTSTSHQMLKGMGKLRVTALISFLGLVAVPLVVILGIFAATLDPYLSVTAGLALGHIVCGVLQMVVGTRVVKASIRTVLFRVYLQPLLVAAVVSVACTGFALYFGIDTPMDRILISFTSILMFSGVAYLTIASHEERQQIGQLLQLILHRVTAARAVPGHR